MKWDKGLLDIFNSIDEVPVYERGYYWYYYKPYWKYHTFYVRACANYWSQKVFYNIHDPEQSFRMIYQWKFQHKTEAFKFIDDHYERLIKSND